MTFPGGLPSLLFGQTRAAEEESGRIYDAVVGVVTDIADPQKLCRVKVRFPTLGPDATWWCPLVVPGAGRDRGWFTVPEVDDEVLVVFEHGDVARPVIVGALWNGKDKAVDANADGKNARRVVKSRSGHKVTFEDVEQYILIEDGGGIASVKIDAKNNTIELTAKQGDVGIQCKDELTILAGEIAIKAKGTCDLMGKSAGVNASATATVKIDGSMVALKGSTIDINPGGVAKAAKASGTVAEVPGSDPGTNTTSAGGGAQGQAAAGGDGGAGGAGGSSGGTAVAEAATASAGPSAAASAAEPPPEPVPAVLSAAWSQPTAKAGEKVKLTALALELSGQAATFEIKPADGGAAVATVRGTCGAMDVEAEWTAPGDGPPSQFVFQVSAGGCQADSGPLTLVKPFKATLVLDEQPAFGVEVELEVVDTGERIAATANDKGVIDIPAAPAGPWRLHLVGA